MADKINSGGGPGSTSQELVDAIGALTDAWETVERARGHLYSFHQLIGSADLELDAAVEGLRNAGEPELADRVEQELIGRNVVPGKWTFEVIEDFDSCYYDFFRDLEREVRQRLLGGRRHVHEARLKQRRQSHAQAEGSGSFRGM